MWEFIGRDWQWKKDIARLIAANDRIWGIGECQRKSIQERLGKVAPVEYSEHRQGRVGATKSPKCEGIHVTSRGIQFQIENFVRPNFLRIRRANVKRASNLWSVSSEFFIQHLKCLLPSVVRCWTDRCGYFRSYGYGPHSPRLVPLVDKDHRDMCAIMTNQDQHLR